MQAGLENVISQAAEISSGHDQSLFRKMCLQREMGEKKGDGRKVISSNALSDFT